MISIINLQFLFMYNSQFAIIFILFIYIYSYLFTNLFTFTQLIPWFIFIHFIFHIYNKCFFPFYVYNGLTSLNRSFTKFSSLNKNRNSVKIPSYCLRWPVGRTLATGLWKSENKQKFFVHNNNKRIYDFYKWEMFEKQRHCGPL